MPLYLYILVVCCFFCKRNDLEVISATSQNWAGGIAGLSGTRYIISVKTNKPFDNLTIDRLWIGDKFMVFKLSSLGNRTGKIEFQKNDTLVISVNKRNLPDFMKVGKNDDSGGKITEDPEKPFEYKGVALIGYKTGNKRKYLTVEKFKILKQVNYP